MTRVGLLATRRAAVHARYTVQTITGPKCKTIYGKTRQEVDKKLTEAKADRDSRLLFDTNNLKICEYLTPRLRDSVKDTVSQRTYEHYEQIVRVRLKPTLGGIKLKPLIPTHMRRLYR